MVNISNPDNPLNSPVDNEPAEVQLSKEAIEAAELAHLIGQRMLRTSFLNGASAPRLPKDRMMVTATVPSSGRLNGHKVSRTGMTIGFNKGKPEAVILEEFAKGAPHGDARRKTECDATIDYPDEPDGFSTAIDDLIPAQRNKIHRGLTAIATRIGIDTSPYRGPRQQAA